MREWLKTRCHPKQGNSEAPAIHLGSKVFLASYNFRTIVQHRSYRVKMIFNLTCSDNTYIGQGLDCAYHISFSNVVIQTGSQVRNRQV